MPGLYIEQSIIICVTLSSVRLILHNNKFLVLIVLNRQKVDASQCPSLPAGARITYVRLLSCFNEMLLPQMLLPP